MRNITPSAAILLSLVAFSAFAAEEKTPRDRAFDKAVIAYRMAYPAAKAKALDTVRKDIVVSRAELQTAKTKHLADLEVNVQKKMAHLEALKNSLSDSAVPLDFAPASATFKFFTHDLPLVSFNGVYAVPYSYMGAFPRIERKTTYVKGKPVVTSKTVTDARLVHAQFRFFLAEKPVTSRNLCFHVTDTKIERELHGSKITVPIVYAFPLADVHVSAFPPKEEASPN